MDFNDKRKLHTRNIRDLRTKQQRLQQAAEVRLSRDLTSEEKRERAMYHRYEDRIESLKRKMR